MKSDNVGMEVMDFSDQKGGSGNKSNKLAGVTGVDDLIKATNTVNFIADVIEVSHRIPVIADFWAPWCRPCRTLGPVLEKLVRQFSGKVCMVKVNLDENQGLASQLKVTSIPVVFAFKNGALIDRFMGVLPESQVKAFINRVVGSASSSISHFDKILAEAKALLEQNNPKRAEVLYRQCLEQDQTSSVAMAGVVDCLIARGDNDGARNLLRQLPADLLVKHEIETVRTKLELSTEPLPTSSRQELKRVLEAEPNNHRIRYDLAMAHYRAGSYQAAVDELLEIVRRDRSWSDDGARRQLVKLFKAIGLTDPLTVQSRRQLSSIMFS